MSRLSEVLDRLAATIEARKGADAASSYPPAPAAWPQSVCVPAQKQSRRCQRGFRTPCETVRKLSAPGGAAAHP